MYYYLRPCWHLHNRNCPCLLCIMHNFIKTDTHYIIWDYTQVLQYFRISYFVDINFLLIFLLNSVLRRIMINKCNRYTKVNWILVKGMHFLTCFVRIVWLSVASVAEFTEMSDIFFINLLWCTTSFRAVNFKTLFKQLNFPWLFRTYIFTRTACNNVNLKTVFINNMMHDGNQASL